MDDQYQITEQQKSDATEVARRTEFDRKVAASLPRASHEVADEARFEDEKRKAHPLPGEAGYKSVKDTFAQKAAKEADEKKARRAADEKAAENVATKRRDNSPVNEANLRHEVNPAVKK